MSLNRHSSSRRKLNKSKKARRRKSSESSVNYESLEERRLLAIDVGLNFTGSTFGRGSSPPNLAGGIGPNHVVEVINNQFQIFDKATGNLMVNKPLDSFWLDTGGAGAQSDPQLVAGTSNARVLYDADTRRWFITSVSTMDVITGAPGTQSATLLAVSRTSDPTQDWQSTLNFYDVDNDPETPPNPFRGGFLSAGAGSITTNLSVDDHNVYVTLGEASPFVPPQIWAFNKFADLVVPNPVSTNASAYYVSSPQLQWGSDAIGDTVGAFGLWAPPTGNQIMLSEFADPEIAGGATLLADVAMAADPYEAPPQFIRQEFDPDIVNTGTGFLSSTKRVGNSLWAVHTILGSGNGQNPDGGVIETSAIRWYEVDLDTKTIKQSGTIEHDFLNYIFPSIAVTPEGHVAISYTSTGVGPTPADGVFPTLTVSVGYSNNGTMTMEDPVNLKDGEGGYFDGAGNFWGRYGDTIADPNDPTKIWVFGEWSDDSDAGQTQIVEISLIGLSPELEGTPDDNVIVLRRSALDSTQIEVEIDGTVIQTYEEAILYSIQIDGMGGDDTFIVDTSNGELDFPGGAIFVGDGDDQIDVQTVVDTTWEIALDGQGEAAIGNDFPASCDVVHQDLVTFNLNFDPNSLWFDNTVYTSQYGTTYGEALRGELQNYFVTVMAPIFAGTFTMTLDIKSDEVDTLASAEAFGYSFHEVNGQNLWAATPWSILTGRGDTNGSANSDGVIDYNLDLDLYGGDREALLANITGGLTRSQFFRVLGMESFIPNETQTFDPRGNRDVATVMDTRYRDLNDAWLVGNYDANDSTFEVLPYVSNGNWAGDNTGMYFVGIDDVGAEMRLAINSNTELIDFDTIASSLAGTSRDGDFNDIIEQDRAFLRGLGYDLNPVTPPILNQGFKVSFSGLDEIQAGDGVDNFCIKSSNVDLQISGGIGNDIFNVTGLGVGAINLFGEGGDDTYTVVFSPAGVITIGDSLNSENDTLIGLGTSSVDHFVFDVNGIKVNAGLLVYVGVENTSFDGLDSDDVFEIKAVYPGVAGLNGGAGNDTFIVNSSGLGDTLSISVDDPATDPADRLRLDITSAITDSYTADEIENFHVDGTFVIDGVNGTPTVAGGINLMGDGNETLILNSVLDASWIVSGDGAGNLTMDTADPLTFNGIAVIEASFGVDAFDIQNTNTDLLVNGRDGADSFLVNNVGSGVVTINGQLGVDDFNVTNSGGGVVLRGNEDNDTFTFNDFGTGIALLSGNEGDDTFDVLHSGTAGLTIEGDAGQDTINIDNIAGSAPIMAFGAGDNDLFNVINSGLGQLDLMGEGGDDTYVVDFVNGATVFNITDSPNAENDTLIVNGSSGNDIFDISNSNASVNGGTSWTIIGIENFEYDGGLGDDTFNVATDPSFSGTINLSGNDGNDSFVINESGLGTVNLNGEAGDDTYTVFFKPNTNVTIVDSLNAENDAFFGFGTNGVDQLALAIDAPVVNGGTVVMSGIESVEFDALGATDVYDISTAIGNSTFKGGGGNDIFNIAQTVDGNQFVGDDGNDTFNIATSSGAADFFGNAGADTFNVTQTTGNGDFFGGTGNDLFNINSATGDSNFFGEDGTDRFVITNHLPKNSPGLIAIDGGADRNQIVVNGYQGQTNMVVVGSTQISGLSAVPINYTAAGSFSIANGVGGIQLIGSDTFSDAFDVNGLLAENSLSMLGGGGNDRFTVSLGAIGGVSADGQEGSDIYQYAIGSQNHRFLFALDTGVVGADRIVASLSDGDDVLNLSGESFAVQTDNFGFNKNFESLVVNARGGNDTIDINRLSVDFMRILAGGGDDQINVNNFTGVNSIVIDAGAGNDEILVNAGTVAGVLTALGGAGDDSFLISQRSYGNAIIDGQEGSDRYDVFFADRSDRFIVARDSGTIGQDHLSVYGTVLDDVIEFRSGVVRTPHQDVLYTQTTETMSLLTEGSNDNITVYGVSSPITNIMGQAGNDLIHVKSTFGPALTKVVNVDAGTGDDNILVSGTNADTTTNVFGRGGNDNLTIGSSFAANNGNLNNLFGTVFASGGSGNDRLYINDAGKNASFNYEVGPTFVRNGGSPSNFFAGITYDATVETLRLDTTNFLNQVLVTPNFNTNFSFFGNNGLNTISLTGDPAVDGRQFFGTDGGVGFFTFGNGARDIFFSNFFLG